MTPTDDPRIQRTQSLVGMRLEAVRYYTLPYGLQDRPAWDFGDAHAVDYGVGLVGPGRTKGITWTPYGNWGYGIDVVDGPILASLTRGEFSAVTDEQPWADVCGTTIVDARLHWFEERAQHDSAQIPCGLTIRFDNQHTVGLVAASWNERDASAFPTGDDIVIIWTPTAARTLTPFLPDLLSKPDI